MKKIPWFRFAFCLIFLIPAMGLAQDPDDPENKETGNKPYGEGSRPAVNIPPGMEMRSMGGIHMIVPEGTRIRKDGSLLVMENTDEFSARNFKEINERLRKMEVAQDGFEKTVEALKQEVSDLSKR